MWIGDFLKSAVIASTMVVHGFAGGYADQMPDYTNQPTSSIVQPAVVDGQNGFDFHEAMGNVGDVIDASKGIEGEDRTNNGMANERSFDESISPEELKYLDDNTMDTDFLDRARDADGNAVGVNESRKQSPFVDQEYTNGAFYPDAWKPTQIEDGTTLYQLRDPNSPWESPYYTDAATVDSCRNPQTGEVDLDALKDKLQIKDDGNLKNDLQAYHVDNPNGIRVAEGHAVENPWYGEGGGKQYFIPDKSGLQKGDGINNPPSRGDDEGPDNNNPPNGGASASPENDHPNSNGNSGDKPQANVYFITDEFSLIPNLQHVDDAVNFGRSLGVKFMIGIQNIDQVYENYGENRARSLLSGFLTSICFRVNDGKSKEYIRELHGVNRKKEIYMASVQGRGIVESLRDANVVEDWDITRLAIGQAIIGFPGKPPFIFQFKKS